MDLSDYLLGVATTYDQTAGFEDEAGDLLRAQRLLKEAPDHLQLHVPIGYRIQGSGGQYRDETASTFTLTSGGTR